MANDLIPEPNIQATNIPTGGAPQVSFAPWATPKNTFASLSKTIAGAAQTMVNFNDLEDREAESRDAWKEQLDQIHGLTKTGQLSEADYMKIQREANAKAQKEGMIRAHENWSTMTANSKDRAGIVANALEAELKTKWSSITNPDDDFATSIEGAEAEFFSPNEQGGYDVLGTDFNGNPVTADTSTMNPMELVALSQAVSTKRTAVEAAREEVRHQRTLEARQNAMSAGVYQKLGDFKVNRAQDPTAEASNEVLMTGLRGIVQQAHDEGVPDINQVIMDAVSDYINDEVSNPTNLENPLELKGLINRTIGLLQSEFSYREDEKDDPIMFAGQGSKNNITLDKLRKSAFTAIDTLVGDASTKKDEALVDFDAWAKVELGKFGTMTDNEKNAVNQSALAKIDELEKLHGVTFSMDETQGMINSLDKTGAMLALSEVEGEFTGVALSRKVEANLTDFADMDAILEFSKELTKDVNNGDMTKSAAATIVGEALTNFEAKEKDSAKKTYASDTAKSLYGSLVTSYSNIDTSDKLISDIVKNMTVKGGAFDFSKFFGAKAIEADTDLRNALYREATQMLTIASEGGVIKSQDLLSSGYNFLTDQSTLEVGGALGLMDKADKKRLRSELPNYEEVAQFFKEERAFQPMREMSTTEALEFNQYMELRMKHMAQISAAMQKANIIDEEVKARAANPQEGLTVDIDAYTSEARSLWINFIEQEN